jgi:hypothetical protein
MRLRVLVVDHAGIEATLNELSTDLKAARGGSSPLGIILADPIRRSNVEGLFTARKASTRCSMSKGTVQPAICVSEDAFAEEEVKS